jgi:sn-glycerol 3-phosphate transport system permease protein
LSAPKGPAVERRPPRTSLQPGAGGTLTLPSAGVRTEVSRLTLGRERPRIPWARLLIHAALIVCVAIIAFPLYYAFVISTQEVSEVVQKPPRLLPSTHLVENYVEAWRRSGMARMLVNSTIVAVGVAVGKIAIVYFRFRGASLVFWLIFLTLMLPIPVRILPTYEVIGNIGWLNTYAGLTVPLMASATATFLFRQFYLTIPNELAEAAQIDGAGPLRFLWSFLLPLSWANIAALFVVLFIYGWNEYFWPLLITNTEEMRTVVIGLERLIPRSGTELPTWNLIMAGAMMALLPPVAVIIFMQRWFVKGLVESEK